MNNKNNHILKIENIAKKYDYIAVFKYINRKSYKTL